MNMHLPEVSMKQYEETRRQAMCESNVPKGAKFHTAWFAQDGLRVLDIWESRSDFEQFAAGQLMPAVRRLGIQGQPKVQFETAHAIFAPDVSTK
jgi:hypothetical protein